MMWVNDKILDDCFSPVMIWFLSFFVPLNFLSSFLFFYSDPHTLVELVNFSTLGKMQPFSIDVSTNCLLLMVIIVALGPLSEH